MRLLQHAISLGTSLREALVAVFPVIALLLSPFGL